MQFYYILLIISLISSVAIVSGISDDEENLELLSAASSSTDDILNTPYCFRFTWLGRKYDADSQFKNATCDDVLKKTTGVPCTLPLVVTNNSNIPDTDYMWEEYKSKPLSVACRLVRGEVCAKFSYSYNNAVENITYMCTKLIIEGESVSTSGCYREKNNGREVEVCVCESSANRKPCNIGNANDVNIPQLFISIILFLFIKILNGS